MHLTSCIQQMLYHGLNQLDWTKAIDASIESFTLVVTQDVPSARHA